MQHKKRENKEVGRLRQDQAIEPLSSMEMDYSSELLVFEVEVTQ